MPLRPVRDERRTAPARPLRPGPRGIRSDHRHRRRRHRPRDRRPGPGLLAAAVRPLSLLPARPGPPVPGGLRERRHPQLPARYRRHLRLRRHRHLLRGDGGPGRLRRPHPRRAALRHRGPDRLRRHHRHRGRRQHRPCGGRFLRRRHRLRRRGHLRDPGRQGAGRGQIVAVDPVASRREAALRFGATEAVSPEEFADARTGSPQGRDSTTSSRSSAGPRPCRRPTR